MNDTAIFDEMIRDRARVKPKKHYKHSKVVLQEPSCKDSRVEVMGLPDNAIIVKADSWPAPDKVFAGKRGECKRADYVIVAEKNGKTVLVYIEMKKNTAEREEIVRQLAGARCFLDYCLSIGREFWKKRDFLKDAEHRFVAFCHTSSIRKRKTRVTSGDGAHDRPDRFLKIDWAKSIQFNKIVGRV